MITSEYVRIMARYNEWQNKSTYEAASLLSDEDRFKDQGAFFGSIHCTLSHLLWGDQIWMHRFADTPKPQADGIQASAEMILDWKELCKERKSFDDVILNWSSSLTNQDLEGDLMWYSGAAKRDVIKPIGFLVTHMFNHQTHHRGQVHAMVTSCGGKIDDTDLFFLE
ncbi:MAG: DinB family protein [Pseudomonadota bacterium]